MRIRVTLEKHGVTATGAQIPDSVVEELGRGRRPAVVATIGDYSYRTSIASMGGRFLLPVSAEVRAATGVAAGDAFDLDVVVDDAPREVQVPSDLAGALDADPGARTAFDGLSYSNKRRLVMAIDAAKTAETRQRRIASTVADLH